jgi:hypothetical protein
MVLQDLLYGLETLPTEHRCGVCNRPQPSAYALRAHLRLHKKAGQAQISTASPARSNSPGTYRPSGPGSVKCPACGSGPPKKIGLARKAGAAGLVGVLSIGYASKTFKCTACGYTW